MSLVDDFMAKLDFSQASRSTEADFRAVLEQVFSTTTDGSAISPHAYVIFKSFLDTDRIINVLDHPTDTVTDYTGNNIKYSVSQLADSLLINDEGEVFQLSKTRAIIHEFMHAINGWEDLDPSVLQQFDNGTIVADFTIQGADYFGQVVTATNTIIGELGYPAEDYRSGFLTGLEYGKASDYEKAWGRSDNFTNGNTIDNTIVNIVNNIEIDTSANGKRDLILGSQSGELINVGDEDDFVYGGFGEDVIFGGAGRDYIEGGADDDILISGELALDQNGQVSVTHTSLASANDTDNDQLFGGEGADHIVSTGGRDLLVGGAGDDKFYAYTPSYNYNQMEELEATNGSELGTLIWGGEGADEYHFFSSIGGSVDDFKVPKIAVIQIDGLTGSEWPDVDLDKLHTGIKEYLTFGSGVQYTHVLINPDEEDSLFVDGVQITGGTIAPSDVENDTRIEIDDYDIYGYTDEDGNIIPTGANVRDSRSIVSEYDVNAAYIGAGNRFWVAGYHEYGDDDLMIDRYGGGEIGYNPNGDEINYNFFDAYDVQSKEESFSLSGFTNGMFGINFGTNPKQIIKHTAYSYDRFSVPIEKFYAFRDGELGYGTDVLSALQDYDVEITNTEVDTDDEQYLLGENYLNASTFTFNIEDFLNDDDDGDGGDGNPDPDTVAPVVIAGTDGSEEIDGGAGHDELDGRGGDDQIDGKAGDDTIRGGEGDDTLRGGDGADTMLGGNGDDTVYADADDTWFSGDGGVDTLIYQGSDDRQYAMDQGAFENMEAGVGNNTVWGTAGHNIIDGQAGNDVIHGYGGDDTLIGGSGADSLMGGDGNDTVYADADDTWFSGDAGIDTLIYQGTDDRQYAMDQGAFENMEAGAGNNTVWGTAGHNIIGGQAGNDVIHGYGGDDTLIGGSGADSLMGGDGNDTVYADADDIWFSGDAGIDTLIYLGTDDRQYSLAQGAFENAQMGSGNNVVWGTDAANSIDGQAGDDTLFGYGGSDRIISGSGSDYLVGGADNDTFVFALGEAGHDTIADFEAGDVIEFDASLFSNFADVLASASDDGGSTTITIDANTSIRLDNVLVGQLQLDDFHFV